MSIYLDEKNPGKHPPFADASLDIVKMNGHNTYKDRIRTWELQARIKMNM